MRSLDPPPRVASARGLKHSLHLLRRVSTLSAPRAVARSFEFDADDAAFLLARFWAPEAAGAAESKS